MGLLDFIFGINCGGLPRESFDEEEALDSGRYVPVQDAPGVCNNCGREFHPIHINCWCPARCGGRVYSK